MIGDLSSRPRHGPVDPPDDPEGLESARALLREHAGQELLRALEESDTETLEDQVAVTRVPAPPFEEEARARWMAERFRAGGLREVEIDGTGNALGLRPGIDPSAPPIVVSAHLDTVFPPETPIEVRHDGDRILAPGISDDGRGLAAILAIRRVLDEVGVRTVHPILFAATVGEEGVGDLRGVRGLFAEGRMHEAVGFVSLDGAGVGRVVTSGVGSRRYRIAVRGPGGHSWVDWGRPNPIAILSDAIQGLPPARKLPPATTWSAGRIGGGTSVNAIPEEAWVEMEVRAERAEDLERVDAELRASFTRAVTDANLRAARSPEFAALNVRKIGDRPAGSTPSENPLVRAAVAATRALDLPVELATSSTDSNLPMSLGIPAITIGAGGEAGGAHTVGEWFRNVAGPTGIYRAVLTLLLHDGWMAERGEYENSAREAAD